MNLAHVLQQQAQSNPGQPALFDGTKLHATHGQWAERASAAALRLKAAGLVPGDRVLLFAHNHPRYLELLFAAWWAGLVVVPVNAKLHPREVEWIIDNAGARWGFVTADVAPEPLAGLERQVELDSPQADALLAPFGAATAITERGPDDLAWLFYTSGTTGRPKGVMLTHRNLRTMAMGYLVDVDPIAPTDAMVYGAPMSHGCGLYALPHLMAGARHVVPASRGVDPAELFALGQQLGPLSTFAAPTIVNRLVRHATEHGLSVADCALSWKTIVYGGAPMYAADIQRALAVMGPRFVQIYGQGETPMVATVLSRATLADQRHPQWAERVASVGHAQTPVRVQVADAEGRTLPNGEVGEVLVQGDTVMAGYWRNPDATRATVRNGWLFTGDMGSLDAHGYLTLKDRSKDLIISGGSNIYPREVEEALLTAPGVAEVAVVGEPDAEWGEAVVAFVVPTDAARAAVGSADSPECAEPFTQALDAHCLGQLGRFKRPKRYVWVDALPKNNTGKVLKTELRQRLTDRTTQPNK
jgi:long-chain acyl-CoA synthetase